jgi:hypothetical protein
LQKSYLDEQNFAHHEHIHGVTESSWALTGALISHNSNLLLPRVTPMASPQEFNTAYLLYMGWNREIMRVGGFDHIYYLSYFNGDFDLHLLKIKPAGHDEHRHILYFADGTAAAEIWEKDGLGYIMMYRTPIITKEPE